MLREHLDGVLLRKSGVDVAVQPPHELVEGPAVFAVVGDEGLDALDVLFGNLGDVLGPEFPVAFGADLGHQFGIEDVLQVVEAHRELGGELLGSARGARLAVAVAVLVFVLARGADSAEEDVFGLLFRQFDFVDLGIETVVVGPQGVQHGPDHLEVGVVFEHLVALGIGRNHDRNDDISVFLALAAAHDATDRLHDIDLRVLRRNEDHGVERRDIDTLREAAGVGQHTAFAFVFGLLLEPHQLLVAFGGRHRSINMMGNDIDHRGAVLLADVLHVEVLVVGEGVGDCPGCLDARTEGHGTAHRQRVGTLDELLVGAEHLFREGIDAADEFRGVIRVDGSVLAGQGLLQRGGNVLFAHGEDEDLVVGEQFLFDSLAEADAVDLVAVHRAVVHRAEDGGVLLGAFLRLVGIEAWRGGHVDAAHGAQEVVVVDPDKGALGLILERNARGAVRLVADDEVERAEGVAGLLEQLLLGPRNDFDGLVGREDDGQPLGIVSAGVLQLFDDGGDVGRGRKCQVDDTCRVVVVLFGLFRDLRVGADADGHHRLQSLLQPRPQGLSQQGNRGYEEQHQTAASGFVLGNSQRGEGFARAAGHDELAARMGGLAGGFVNLEIGVGLVDGLLLVLPYGKGFGSRGHAEDALFEAVPVDIVVFEVDKVQTGYRRILIADGLLGHGVPFVRRRDPQSLHESRHAGFGLEAFARG